MNVVIFSNVVFVKVNLVNASVRFERSILNGLSMIKLSHLTLRWDTFKNKGYNGLQWVKLIMINLHVEFKRVTVNTLPTINLTEMTAKLLIK